jgi:hypothetical protein
VPTNKATCDKTATATASRLRLRGFAGKALSGDMGAAGLLLRYIMQKTGGRLHTDLHDLHHHKRQPVIQELSECVELTLQKSNSRQLSDRKTMHSQKHAPYKTKTT